MANTYLQRKYHLWGLVNIEKAERGHSYTSQGEHGIRAGVTVEPTRVTFTAWGFTSMGTYYLERVRVAASWFCYENDFGQQTAVLDQSTTAMMDSENVKGKDFPDLGAMGLSPEQMERLCGAPTKPTTDDPEHHGATCIQYHKGDYDLLCSFFAGKLYKTVFWRSDHKPPSATDTIIWLLQNGTGWREEHRYSYIGGNNRLRAADFSEKDSGRPSLEGLEVIDTTRSP